MGISILVVNSLYWFVISPIQTPVVFYTLFKCHVSKAMWCLKHNLRDELIMYQSCCGWIYFELNKSTTQMLKKSCVQLDHHYKSGMWSAVGAPEVTGGRKTSVEVVTNAPAPVITGDSLTNRHWHTEEKSALHLSVWVFALTPSSKCSASHSLKSSVSKWLYVFLTGGKLKWVNRAG